MTDESRAGSRDHIALRKSLRRAAERKHGEEMEWVGGILYFKGTKKAVPGVAHVPKPGMPTIGLAAHRGAEPPPRNAEAGRRASVALMPRWR